MPAQHGELAGGGHDRDLHATARLHPLVERPQRAGRLGRRPGRLDQHPAGVGRTGFGDPAVTGRRPAGLAHPGVEPEVGHQLLRGAEPGEVPDRGHDRQRHGRVDPGHRHQPQHLRPIERDLPEIGVDQP
jgi:hypothetical protein